MFEDVAYVQRAFAVLSRTRRVDGMAGAQAISVLEIDAYARLHGIAGYDAEELCDLVLAMDRHYMERAHAERERAREKSAPEPKDAAEFGG